MKFHSFLWVSQNDSKSPLICFSDFVGLKKKCLASPKILLQSLAGYVPLRGKSFCSSPRLETHHLHHLNLDFTSNRAIWVAPQLPQGTACWSPWKGAQSEVSRIQGEWEMSSMPHWMEMSSLPCTDSLGLSTSLVQAQDQHSFALTWTSLSKID